MNKRLTLVGAECKISPESKHKIAEGVIVFQRQCLGCRRRPIFGYQLAAEGLLDSLLTYIQPKSSRFFPAAVRGCFVSLASGERRVT